jgi:hypothetical protein
MTPRAQPVRTQRTTDELDMTTLLGDVQADQDLSVRDQASVTVRPLRAAS